MDPLLALVNRYSEETRGSLPGKRVVMPTPRELLAIIVLAERLRYLVKEQDSTDILFCKEHFFTHLNLI